MNALTFEIPAFCPECGCTVGTGVRFVEGTSEVAFEDCVTICHCGAEAEIPDGTYAYIDGVVELLDDNTITRASLDQIASVLKSSRARDVTPEQLVAEVEEIEPSLCTPHCPLRSLTVETEPGTVEAPLRRPRSSCAAHR
jgi:hypothetical protein